VRKAHTLYESSSSCITHRENTMSRFRTKYPRVRISNKNNVPVLRKVVGCKPTAKHKQEPGHTCRPRGPKAS
jgi:hypothetical protein